MTLYAKIILLDADGNTKMAVAIVRIQDEKAFTDEMAAVVLTDLAQLESRKNKAVSTKAEWISPVEAVEIISQIEP